MLEVPYNFVSSANILQLPDNQSVKSLIKIVKRYRAKNAPLWDPAEDIGIC